MTKDNKQSAEPLASLLEVLTPDDDQDFDFEPPKACGSARPVDFEATDIAILDL